MKTLVFLLTPVFVSLNLFAQLTKSFIALGEDRHVYYESQLVDSSRPTVVLLPGVYRGLSNQDDFIYKLFRNNFNFVALNFSTQPDSVATYLDSQTVYFKDGKNVTSADLAREVEQVLLHLKIQKPMLVSLSYSGTLMEHFDRQKYPFVVETAPIGRIDEDLMGWSQISQAWENWLIFFPGATEFYKAMIKDQFYRSYWSDVAKKYSKGNARLQSDEKQKMLTDGYVAQAKAIERYDIRKQNFTQSPRRVFILGEKEKPLRLQLQLEAIAEYKKQTGDETSPIMIPDAGHSVPFDKPQIYFDTITNLLKQM